LRGVYGFEQPGDFDRVLVFSPHLDDAVMSCGGLLLAHPGAIVATVFAATPPAYTDPLNEHDQACGFVPGDDTMGIRRAEDVRALAAVGAQPRWLEFCQNSHAPRADPIAIPPGVVEAMFATVAEVKPTAIVAPLGLLHADHQACHAAALALRAGVEQVPWLWYSDVPYCYIPGVLTARFRALHRSGLAATPACPPVSHDFTAKWRAFTQYATQLAPMDAPWRLHERLERAGEAYWLIDGPE
jgi:LmbE family N-acetylglucosaminyl deacetylase